LGFWPEVEEKERERKEGVEEKVEKRKARSWR
jgi:hypothetical protein